MDEICGKQNPSLIPCLYQRSPKLLLFKTWNHVKMNDIRKFKMTDINCFLNGALIAKSTSLISIFFRLDNLVSLLFHLFFFVQRNIEYTTSSKRKTLTIINTDFLCWFSYTRRKASLFQRQIRMQVFISGRDNGIRRNK